MCTKIETKIDCIKVVVEAWIWFLELVVRIAVEDEAIDRRSCLHEGGCCMSCHQNDCPSAKLVVSIVIGVIVVTQSWKSKLIARVVIRVIVRSQNWSSKLSSM